MTKLNFPINSYPWYVHNWRQSMTRLRLDPLGRYIYRELLDQCYIEGSLPNDTALLAKIAELRTPQFLRIWPDVAKSFTLKDDGRWHHEKVDQVLNDITKWREQKANAGRASGASRKPSVKQPLNGIEHALNGRSTADELSVSVSVKESVKVQVANPSPSAVAFDVLYTRHPKKQGKLIAEQHFTTVMSQVADEPALIVRIERGHSAWCRSEQWTKEGGRFAPTLSNWLREHGWEDELPVNGSASDWDDSPDAVKRRYDGALADHNRQRAKQGLPSVTSFE